MILYQNKKFYLGGFKTWECSHDLVDYLKSLIENFQDITTVIEVRQITKECFFLFIICIAWLW
jgi:hypothetical protein